MSIQIRYMGYDFHEDHRFMINRPEGSKDFLFLFFLTPVNLLLEGRIHTTKPYAVIIFQPECPQYYSNKDSGFINDFFHMSGEELPSLLEKLQLPLNLPFYIDQNDFIREFVRKLELEYKLKDFAFEDNIHALLTHFFIQLARYHHHLNNFAFDPIRAEIKDRLREIRSSILTKYDEAWDVDKMANLAQLSRSRFSVLYKSFFGISPKEDLIRERMNMAKYLLCNTSTPVQEVSLRVGYENSYHFNKQFKKSVGTSPGRFRRDH